MTATATTTIPVTMRALIQRINRKLKAKDGRLCACRSKSRWRHDLGDYYCVDVCRNQIVDTHVDPEELATRLGVLQPFEKVIDAEETQS